MDDLTDYRCPDCGQEFEAVWRVTVGDSTGYTAVLAPEVRDVANCGSCDARFERTEGGHWRHR